MTAILDRGGLAFSPELVRASLVLALVAVAAMVALLARLGRGDGRRFFHSWSIGWMFFAAFLAAKIAGNALQQDSLSQMVPAICLWESALFMIAGGLEMMEVKVSRRLMAVLALLAVCIVFLAYFNEAGTWVVTAACSVLAGATALGGILFLRNRQPRRSLSMVSGGLIALALPLVAMPVFASAAILAVGGYVAVAAFALLITLGMVVEYETETSEQKYRSVLDGLNEAVFMVDLWTLKILDLNQMAARFARTEPTELVGASFLELCPDLRHEGSNLLDHRKMFSTVFKPYNEFHFVRADGSMLLCEGDTSLVQWHNRPVMQVHVRECGSGQNVSQLVRRAEKMSSLGQLIAGVAHELNNPLAVVVAAAQMANKQPLVDDNLKAHLQRIVHESDRAAKIVRDLLSFARPVEPQMRPVEFNRLVSEVLDIRQRELESHQVEVRQHLRPDLARTKADPIQIEQVLNNLITNAMHAMASQPQPRVLRVITTETPHFIRITVEDNGCGIAPDVVNRIFDPFFTTKPPGKGTGLGLSISHSILQEHHGRIWAESELGQGATFHLELPIVPCAEPAASAEPVDTTDTTARNQKTYRVLIVDDEPGIRDVLEAILEDKGYSVTTAGNGHEAIDKIKAETFDMIISDMRMPEMDGEEFYDQLQEINAQLAKRVVFVTGDTVSTKSRTFLERTGTQWLSKPFNIRDVEEIVSATLQREDTLLAQLRGSR